MTHTYKNSGILITGANVFQTVYQCPGGASALIKSIFVVNHSTGTNVTGDRAATIQWRDNSLSNNYYLINSGLIPYQAGLNVVDGTLILESSDSIRAACNSGNCVDVTVSSLEIT